MSHELPPAVSPAPDAPGVDALPLHPADPPRIGDFWLDARLVATTSGVAYLAHGEGRQVMLVTLSHGAAGDPGARDRLAGEVNQLHVDTVVARGGEGQDEGRFADRIRSAANHPPAPGHVPLAPWVALAYDGTPAALAEARRLLEGVDLASTTYLGTPAGPDYRLHWTEDERPGAWRVWPLPWPGRTDRAGWMTVLVSWMLMILTAALALLIAVLLFQNKPPAPPPPPLPTNQTPPPSSSASSSPQSGSPSASPSKGSGSPSPSKGSASPSPSKGSGSPSPSKSQSASPTPSNSGSPSGSASPSASGPPTGHPSDNPSMNSPQPSGTASGNGGSPTPNKRL